MINKHKSNKIKENSNIVRHLNNGTDHRHSKSCCDQSSPARRTITWFGSIYLIRLDKFCCPSLAIMSSWPPVLQPTSVPLLESQRARTRPGTDIVHWILDWWLILRKLTHHPLDKMGAILQTIFSDASLWMKSFVFWIKFHWSLFLRA